MNFDVILCSIFFGFSNVEHGNDCAFFSHFVMQLRVQS